MTPRIRSALAPLAAALATSLAVAAPEHALEDPIPPDARGSVLPISGAVLQIKGVSSGVSGKA